MGVRYVNGVAEVAEVKFVPPWHPDHPIWADKNAGDPHRAKFKSLVEQCLDFPPWGGFGAADKTRQLGTILAAYDADIARARAGVI